MRTKLLIAIGLVWIMFAMSTAAFAHDYARDDDGHPLRIIAYAGHAAGVAVEYTVSRPIHWLVSRPILCNIFGHKPKPGDKYFVWE